MKKLLAMCVCTVLVSAYSFAEFVISPSVGYANHFTLSTEEFHTQTSHSVEAGTLVHTIAWHSLAIGLDLGFIGKSGFTFFSNNSVSFAGGMNKSVWGGEDSITFKAQELKGAYWDGELLAGYTFKQVPNLYVTLAGGLGAGGTLSIVPGKVGMNEHTIPTKDVLKMVGFNAGIALHAEAAYYFTKNIGLALSITETPGYGGLFVKVNKKSGAGSLVGSVIDEDSLGSDFGFVNVFRLKLGPTFKF